MDERAVGRVFVLETRRQLAELVQRVIGLRVGRAILERDEFRLAGRLATFDQHVGYAGDGGLRGDSREAALAKNRGLQRELNN